MSNAGLVVLSKPQIGKQFELRIGVYKNPNEYSHALSEGGFWNMSNYISQFLYTPQFKCATTEGTVTVVLATLEELGLPDYSRYIQVLLRAQKLGLKCFPFSVALDFCLSDIPYRHAYDKGISFRTNEVVPETTLEWNPLSPALNCLALITGEPQEKPREKILGHRDFSVEVSSFQGHRRGMLDQNRLLTLMVCPDEFMSHNLFAFLKENPEDTASAA